MKLPIRLDQFLKVVNIAQTGGHAKILIQNGEVWVNDEAEYRRGRKLYEGDKVKVEGETWVVSQ